MSIAIINAKLKGINRKHIHNQDAVSNETSKSDETSPGNRVSDNNNSDAVATYYDLSNHLRYAVGRGYPWATRTSHKQDVHNLDVSKSFLADKDNVDSPYRRKKDWLSMLINIIWN